MGTRSGSLDPGVLLYLMDRHGINARSIETLIYKKSGLLGFSGISSDMRTLLASTDARPPKRLSFSSIESAGNWDRWLPPLADSTHSFSPVALVKTLQRFARAFAAAPVGWDWNSMKRPTILAAR